MLEPFGGRFWPPVASWGHLEASWKRLGRATLPQSNAFDERVEELKAFVDANVAQDPCYDQEMDKIIRKRFILASLSVLPSYTSERDCTGASVTRCMIILGQWVRHCANKWRHLRAVAMCQTIPEVYRSFVSCEGGGSQ